MQRPAVVARHFRELIIWQLAEQLAEEVYRLIRTTPARRDFAFSDQLRDAAGGIATHIADGFPRGATDFARFMMYAAAKLTETENWLNDGVLRGHWRREDLARASALIRRLTPGIRDFLAYLQSPEAQQRSLEFRKRRRKKEPVEPVEPVEPEEPEEPEEPTRSI